MASSSYSISPCAACKSLRRKCLPNCIFSPYFPPEEPQKFAIVHKIFGASNVNKLLNEVLPHQREDAVKSLAYEAEARLKDPVYGCVGAISVLQSQVIKLQKELDATQADLIRYASSSPSPPSSVLFGRSRMGHGGSSSASYDQNSVFYYPSPRSNETCGHTQERGDHGSI
ncbi:hypothetical protein MANES_17G112700v8 [Manihot esculenta]|uniref:LOB domain-containing protein n=2 Tax=Manihot esculenta TaxID=3983 RepID=A0A251IWS2_MANES|nr:hypothetical protein MANES_17G112700v8 [Manihot esculenta]OAY25695.1 hypothetical protein MANES_17G112700v8 [Manihot esculenta]OAY25696.1 hypothetical protein MANES_17G112700v8 [Manihot esculenta]OAY25697.1 hypothetical protein MANES_17G112700v8 [Manihot esculenta]